MRGVFHMDHMFHMSHVLSLISLTLATRFSKQKRKKWKEKSLVAIHEMLNNFFCFKKHLRHYFEMLLLVLKKMSWQKRLWVLLPFALKWAKGPTNITYSRNNECN